MSALCQKRTLPRLLAKFLLGVANSLNAHPFARIAPKLLDVLINERGIEQVGGGDPFVHESQILPEFELAADVGQIQTCEMIAIAQRPLEQSRRHLRLMTNQCQ